MHVEGGCLRGSLRDFSQYSWQDFSRSSGLLQPPAVSTFSVLISCRRDLVRWVPLAFGSLYSAGSMWEKEKTEKQSGNFRSGEIMIR